jgi:hypothetical protein
MSVIKHDFGGETREAARGLRKLLSLDALHDANIRANPLPYLERASERIYQLEKTLFEAVEAASPRSGDDPSPDMITVSRAEYQRLRDCCAIVERGLAETGAADDPFSVKPDRSDGT